MFGQDPTMTHLDTTVCNHVVFFRHPKREVYWFSVWFQHTTPLDIYVWDWILHFLPPFHEIIQNHHHPIFLVPKHTHTQKQHVFFKTRGGGRWYKPSYQDHPPKKTSPIHGVFQRRPLFSFLEKTCSPRWKWFTRTKGWRRTHPLLPPKHLQDPDESTSVFCLVVDCVDGWWMVLKKSGSDVFGSFFREVGWSWGTDYFFIVLSIHCHISMFLWKIRLGPGEVVLFPTKRRRWLFKYIQPTSSFTCRILFGELAVEAVKGHHFRHHPIFKEHIFFYILPLKLTHVPWKSMVGRCIQHLKYIVHRACNRRGHSLKAKLMVGRLASEVFGCHLLRWEILLVSGSEYFPHFL